MVKVMGCIKSGKNVLFKNFRKTNLSSIENIVL
jgi:hypothetical protein